MEKRVYFKNLNALRFFAASAVIFHHVEQYKFLAGFDNAWGNTTIDSLGHKAVSFFFVLSGFLITYLLFEEHKQQGDVNVRNFYIRRILRIWPLYFLIVSICLFVLPYLLDLSSMGEGAGNHFWLVAGLLLLVLPNVVRTISPNIVGGNQLWSIGVEEQFYLVWPLLVKWFRKHFLSFILTFVTLKAGITVLLEMIIHSGYDPIWMQKAFRIWVLLQVEQMAIGAIGAWVLFNRKQAVLQFLYNRMVFTMALLLTLSLFIVPVHHWWINFAEAALFVIVIMNLSTNPDIRLSMEGRWITVLGNISYGIYMYHTLCITVCLFMLKYLGVHQGNALMFSILLYSLSVMSTIVVAYVSYEFFETRFLELKERFMVVKSGKKEVGLSEETVRGPKTTPAALEVARTIFLQLMLVRRLFYKRR